MLHSLSSESSPHPSEPEQSTSSARQLPLLHRNGHPSSSSCLLPSPLPLAPATYLHFRGARHSSGRSSEASGQETTALHRSYPGMQPEPSRQAKAVVGQVREEEMVVVFDAEVSSCGKRQQLKLQISSLPQQCQPQQ